MPLQDVKNQLEKENTEKKGMPDKSYIKWQNFRKNSLHTETFQQEEMATYVHKGVKISVVSGVSSLEDTDIIIHACDGHLGHGTSESGKALQEAGGP